MSSVGCGSSLVILVSLVTICQHSHARPTCRAMPTILHSHTAREAARPSHVATLRVATALLPANTAPHVHGPQFVSRDMLIVTRCCNKTAARRDPSYLPPHHHHAWPCVST